MFSRTPCGGKTCACSLARPPWIAQWQSGNKARHVRPVALARPLGALQKHALGIDFLEWIIDYVRHDGSRCALALGRKLGAIARQEALARIMRRDARRSRNPKLTPASDAGPRKEKPKGRTPKPNVESDSRIPLFPVRTLHEDSISSSASGALCRAAGDQVSSRPRGAAKSVHAALLDRS